MDRERCATRASARRCAPPRGWSCCVADGPASHAHNLQPSQRSHAPQVRAAQPPVRSCCPPGSQSTFCDAHRVATLPAQYRFLPALRHVEAFLTRFTATLTLTFTLTLSGTRARARAQARARGRIFALALALTLTLTRSRSPSLRRHVKASAAFVARRFRWLVFVDDDSFVFPTHLHWHAPRHPSAPLHTPASPHASPPPHPRLTPGLTPAAPPAAPFRYAMPLLHTSAHLPVHPSAPPPHLLCTSSAAPPLHLLCRLLSRLDDSQPLYLGDFGSTEEARRLSVPRSALARTPTLI